MTAIRTAVIPAAGFGTRMLPATRAVPKELLPVGGKPAIQWTLDEAARAGIEHVVIVSSPLKPALGAYVTGGSPTHGAGGDPRGGFSGTAGPGASSCSIELVHQAVPRGLGDAVRIARDAVGDEPFAVLLPDEVFLGGSRLLRLMLDQAERSARSVVGLMRVRGEEIGNYGCVVASPRREGGFEVAGCVEKPAPHAAPSSLALTGRYVLGPDVLDLLDRLRPGRGDEIQLTDALDVAAGRGPLSGVEVLPEDGRFDCGNWSGWLAANLQALGGGRSDRDFAPLPAPEPDARQRVAAGVGGLGRVCACAPATGPTR